MEVIQTKDLCDVLKKYKPNFEQKNIEEIFNRTYQLCFSPDEEINFTNVLHLCYDRKKEKYCAILNLGTTNSLDDVTSLNVDFLFVEPSYRKIAFEELDNIKLSEYILIDYVVGEIGTYIKKNLGIGWVVLTPITEKVREVYSTYGFKSIKESGKNEFEDWMVFNIP